MEVVGIYFRAITAIVLLSALPLKAVAQTPLPDSNFFKKLYNSFDEPVSLTDSTDLIIVLITDKRCDQCIREACAFTHRIGYGSYKVIGVIATRYNLLNLLPAEAECKERFSCLQNILFYFTDKGDAKPAIAAAPAPQLIIRDKKGAVYYSYEASERMVK